MSNKAFHEKFVLVQKLIRVPKGQFNSFGKYSFRSCEDILAALRNILPEYGLFVNICDQVELIGDRYYVKAIASISDGSSSVTSTALARESEAKKGMDESQITGTASSYARKYALAGLLGLDDEDDADSKDNSHNTGVAPAQAKAKAMKDLRELIISRGKTEAGLIKYLNDYYKFSESEMITKLEDLSPNEYDHAMKSLSPKAKVTA